MRPRLIVDCSGRILTALLVTAAGEVVPCSQQIRHVAARYVPSEILFDPAVSETPGFAWDDAAEALAKAGAHNFFQRARRVGLRRAWDEQVADGAFPLVSPLAVLSSPVAFVDEAVASTLPAFCVAVLDALLDPIFRFVAEQRAVTHDVEPVVIVSARTGRRALLALHKIFRRRGFACLAVLRREIAAAMTLAASPPDECLVCEVADENVHLARVAIEAEGAERRFWIASSETLRGLGWTYWLQQIAAAVPAVQEARLDRAMTALLTGAPRQLTHGMLEAALDDVWQRRQRHEIQTRLGRAPALVVGDICGIAAIERVFGGTRSADVPMPERGVRAVAEALLWMESDGSRRLSIAPGGSLRLDTLQGVAAELLPAAELPPPAHDGCMAVDVNAGGAVEPGQPFLVHLQWGADESPEGNATLCAVPVSFPDVNAARSLRLQLHLRRSGAGRRLDGTLDVRNVARVAFTEEFPAFGGAR